MSVVGVSCVGLRNFKANGCYIGRWSDIDIPIYKINDTYVPIKHGCRATIYLPSVVEFVKKNQTRTKKIKKYLCRHRSTLE
jgi:hypothetical protein